MPSSREWNRSAPARCRARLTKHHHRAPHPHRNAAYPPAPFTYALDQSPAFARFLSDGRIEINNNVVENAIRPTAIGKKNWLFIGAADAGQRGAVLYTIVESCRRRGIDPLAYLRDVLTRLPKMTTGQIPEVTPEAWARAHSQCNESRAAA